MASLTVDDLPDAVHVALCVRAADHGSSTEGEARYISAQAVGLADRLLMRTALRHCAEKIGGVELDVHRTPAPIEPATFK